MKIRQLNFRNFRGIKEAEILINGKSTVFIGINGVGKSTILSAINIIFAQLINKITRNKFKQLINLESEDVMFGESIASIGVDIEVGNEIFSYKRTIEKRNIKRTHYAEELEKIIEKFKEEYEPDNSLVDMPIYANYGVNRAVHVVPIKRVHKKHNGFDKLFTYEKAIESRIDFRMFFEWFRDQQESEYIEKVDSDKNYVNKQLKAVKTAVLGMMKEDGFTDIKIMKNPLRMVATKKGINLKIEQLSDGEKCTLAMIGDLARRLAIANPQKEDPLKGEGIVLIDEIELHLHPAWQAKIVPVLRRVFPNVQFIITSHSPKMLGELESDVSVITLSGKGPNFESLPIKSLIGRDVNYILETQMNTSSINQETRKKIDQIFFSINKRDFETAEKLLKELEIQTDSLQPDVVSAKMLIRRGKLKK